MLKVQTQLTRLLRSLTTAKRWSKISTPYLLTALHAVATWAGSSFLSARQKKAHIIPTLRPLERFKLASFSALYSSNIAVGNISLYDMAHVCRQTAALIVHLVYRTN